jgi:hypothetical protein
LSSFFSTETFTKASSPNTLVAQKYHSKKRKVG